MCLFICLALFVITDRVGNLTQRYKLMQKSLSLKDKELLTRLLVKKGFSNDLVNVEIEKLLIEESDLEDIFLHYFKEEYNDKIRA